MALYLPLHIWDRELDSRILLGMLAHRVTTSGMAIQYRRYSRIPASYLFKPDRPRDNIASSE